MVISIIKIVACTFTNGNDVFIVVQGGGGGVSQHTGTTHFSLWNAHLLCQPLVFYFLGLFGGSSY